MRMLAISKRKWKITKRAMQMVRMMKKTRLKMGRKVNSTRRVKQTLRKIHLRWTQRSKSSSPARALLYRQSLQVRHLPRLTNFFRFWRSLLRKSAAASPRNITSRRRCLSRLWPSREPSSGLTCTRSRTRRRYCCAKMNTASTHFSECCRCTAWNCKST